MLQINPKKFKTIKNKSIPNPLRPKFRSRSQTSIYFLSQRKIESEKSILLLKRMKIITVLTAILISGFFLSN
tara:strand:- start:343 stop:558 length:216 start_codon:yes stop_codon:yes gene_type:complete